MNRTEDEEVANKLDSLIRLIAIGLCEGKTQKDQIALLASAGLQPKAIAEILGTTSNTVSVALSNLRKGKAKVRSARVKGAQK